MKKIICYLLIMLYSTLTFSQSFPKKDGKIYFESIDTIEGMTKEKIFDKAKLWFVDYYKNSKEIIQQEDREQGFIIGKAIFNLYEINGAGKGDHACKYTIKIECKDGRYRLQLFDFLYDNDYQLEVIEKVFNEKEKWKKNLESISLDFSLRTSIIKTSLKKFELLKNDW